jgi:hypothetical protein
VSIHILHFVLITAALVLIGNDDLPPERKDDLAGTLRVVHIQQGGPAQAVEFLVPLFMPSLAKIQADVLLLLDLIRPEPVKKGHLFTAIPDIGPGDLETEPVVTLFQIELEVIEGFIQGDLRDLGIVKEYPHLFRRIRRVIGLVRIGIVHPEKKRFVFMSLDPGQYAAVDLLGRQVETPLREIVLIDVESFGQPMTSLEHPEREEGRRGVAMVLEHPDERRTPFIGLDDLTVVEHLEAMGRFGKEHVCVRRQRGGDQAVAVLVNNPGAGQRIQIGSPGFRGIASEEIRPLCIQGHQDEVLGPVRLLPTGGSRHDAHQKRQEHEKQPGRAPACLYLRGPLAAHPYPI